MSYPTPIVPRNEQEVNLNPGETAGFPVIPEGPKADEVQPEGPKAEAQGGKKDDPSSVQKLMAYLGQKGLKVFMGRDGLAYATFRGQERQATFMIDSSEFGSQIHRVTWEASNDVFGDQTIKNLQKILHVQAEDSGDVRDVYLRVARFEDRILIDLGRPNGNLIEVLPGGWSIIPCPPDIHFIRTAYIGRFEEDPEHDVPAKDLDLLFDVVNVDVESRTLVKGWLASTFIRAGGFPILVANGPEGSAKTFGCRAIRSIVDPSPAEDRSVSTKKEDFVAAVNNSWVLAYDNVSDIPAWLSDHLCQLATGGSFARRSLYSNFGEGVVKARRPILLNGIPSNLVERPDLASRCSPIRFVPIARDAFMLAAAALEKLKALTPRIQGALLTMLAEGLANRGHGIKARNRLADACDWAEACKVLPAKGKFTELIAAMSKEAKLMAAEQWKLFEGVVKIAREAGADGKTDTPLAFVRKIRNDDPTLYSTKDWPSGKQMANDLSRYAGVLAEVGVVVQELKKRESRGFVWKLSWKNNGDE